MVKKAVKTSRAKAGAGTTSFPAFTKVLRKPAAQKPVAADKSSDSEEEKKKKNDTTVRISELVASLKPANQRDSSEVPP